MNTPTLQRLVLSMLLVTTLPFSLAYANNIGIAECDKYIQQYQTCIQKMPQRSQAAMSAGLQQQISTWKTISAHSAQGKQKILNACKQAHSANKQTMQIYGCSF
ncbi:MAG: hypothetical protein HOM11_04355 [Methylococcales bacterium]|jgi:hypothetical protein|nr:hypothetical protein [Methylococcales bacterium]MBT7445313.1 hypothetical protein [Methylococcales bacterium]